jgi:hypothetical protein
MTGQSRGAEHPFGTLKCRASYRHFLVRGIRITVHLSALARVKRVNRNEAEGLRSRAHT